MLAANVFELPEVGFKELVNRILITKIECFHAFAIALLSAGFLNYNYHYRYFEPKKNDPYSPISKIK